MALLVNKGKNIAVTDGARKCRQQEPLTLAKEASETMVKGG